MLVTGDSHFSTDPERNAPIRRIIVDAGRSTWGRAVIIAGDFTQQFTASEFDESALLVQELLTAGVTVVATPGNHDFGRVLGEVVGNRKARARYDRAIAEPLRFQPEVLVQDEYDTVTRVGDDLFVALRSAHRKSRLRDRIRGGQIDWARGVLEGLEWRTMRLHLVTHRSLWQEDGDVHARLLKKERLESELLAPYRFQTFIHGHNHLGAWGTMATPRTGYPIFRLSAPTLAGGRSRGHPIGMLEFDPRTPKACRVDP